tara:strand:+ start:839 stop:985 length:147 start_codon:yes stop_codon:yes gene_type:complete
VAAGISSSGYIDRRGTISCGTQPRPDYNPMMTKNLHPTIRDIAQLDAE